MQTNDGGYMKNKLFICFAAEDRYRIVEPILYHIKNYGLDIWYDRYSLVLGDNRVEKNLIEGAMGCKYAIVIISEYTSKSRCAMEELAIIKARYQKKSITIFPVLYEIAPDTLPPELLWVKELIFKETTRQSGTYEICNHIACRITGDILTDFEYQDIQNIIDNLGNKIPIATYEIIKKYKEIDAANLNSRIALLYAAYLTIKVNLAEPVQPIYQMLFCIFERLFNETKLNLAIDYRELWLLENTVCILANLVIEPNLKFEQ